jgi:MATE family, multidrug efflux pump
MSISGRVGACCAWALPRAGSGAFEQAHRLHPRNKAKAGASERVNFMGGILPKCICESLRMSPLKQRSILRLAAPLVVSFWLRSAFAWVDTFFAAELESLEAVNGLGDASIAAIGLALPFEFLSIACWVGTSNGLTAHLAAAMGAGQGDKIKGLKGATLRIILALVVAFLGLAGGIWIWTDRVISDPLLAEQFRIYATILVGGSALTSFWAILPDSIVKAHHDTRGTMWAGLLSGFTNVVLNAVFVFVFRWGIMGIAISTVLGRVAGLTFALYRARGHERLRRLGEQCNAPGVFERPVRAILNLAVPGALTYVLMALESLAVFGLIAKLSPDQQATPLLAAWSIFDRTLRFLLMPAIACSVALLPLVARYSGQQDRVAMRQQYFIANRASQFFVLLLVAPSAFLFGPWLARVLSDTPSTREFAAQAMPFLPFAVAAASPFFLARSMFDGLQKPRPGLLASFIRAFVFFLPGMIFGYWLSQKFSFSPMLGLCGGATLGFALGSTLIHVWVLRLLGSALR